LNEVLKIFPDAVKVDRGDYIATFMCKDRKGKVIFYFKVFVTVSQKRFRKSGKEIQKIA